MTGKTVFSLSALALLITGAALYAGPLDPPAGPVTSTAKTLGEVEPRIAVNATNTVGDANSLLRISQPGSYYLTGNITGVAAKHGIKIDASGVTLDLNGFSLIGIAGSLDGINIPTFRENVVIRNGHIRGWSESGIEGRIDAGRIEHITAVDNGAWGIDNTSASLTTHISSCETLTNGALVAASGGIRSGTASLITDCLAVSNATIGISAGASSTVRGCVSRTNGTNGIVVSSTSVVTNCSVVANTGNGIEVTGGCRIVGNTCVTNRNATGTGAGIRAISNDSLIEGNVCNDANRGIEVGGFGNIIIRNYCSGNTTDWFIAGNNVVGPILDRRAPAAAAINGFSFVGSLGTTDPNANFSY